MPIYEFKCHNCMKITTDVLRITDKRKTTKCRFCGDAAERMISVPNGYKIKGYSYKNGYSRSKKNAKDV